MKKTYIESLADLALRRGKVSEHTATMKLRDWILQFGSDTDDNRAAASRISVKGRQWSVGSRAKVPLSNVAHTLEDMDDVVRHLANKLRLSKADAAAALRLLTLLTCAFDQAGDPTPRQRHDR